MDPAKSEQHEPTVCHLVAMPYPGRSHINAMMNLCKLLASKTADILISFVVTEEWLGFISSEPKPPAQIRFATVPNCIPSEVGRGKDFPGFLKAVNTKMEVHFDELLDRLQPPVKAIVADTHLYWAIGLGNRRTIPVASLYPMPAMVFSVLHHFELLVQNQHFPVDLSGESKPYPYVSSVSIKMDPAKTEQPDPTVCHLVAMPYPGRSHINAMMNLCKLLASKTADILISFVVTEEWLGFMSSEPKPPAQIRFATVPNCIPSEVGRGKDFPGFLKAVNTKMEVHFEELLDRLQPPVKAIVADTHIRFATVPNCIPSEVGRGKDFPGFLKAVNTKMEVHFEELLDRLQPPVKAIVADTHVYWAIGLGNRRNIPVASLYPMPAMVFSVLHHFELLVQNQHFPVDLSGESKPFPYGIYIILLSYIIV
ncbi:udp-glycosyltransferase 87a1 [Quercus suber]|uniref:Udp-glycosyltransferase 87a1 n=1 Tax=Quercus suber TaxID=58331 RepID=A0AAW0IQC3_QUESU